MTESLLTACSESINPAAMEPLPQRTSLIHETATTLKEWIRRGILRDVLPGELQLKARLGVGRDTLRHALKILADDGWVTNASKGQQRRVQSGRTVEEETSPVAGVLPVTFLSPNPVECRVTLLELEDTQKRLSQQGRAIRFIAPEIFQLKHPEKQLDRIVRTHPSSAWILHMSNLPMQKWFGDNGVPALIYGLPFPGVNLPYVGCDWAAGAYHAGVQLLRQGHRVIGFVERTDPSPGSNTAREGLEQAMASVGDRARLLSVKNDLTPASVARSIDHALNLKERPTALVFSATVQLLAAYSWLAHQGVRVPADLSLISLANDSWLSGLYPAVSYYEPDTKMMSKAIAQRVMDLVMDGRVTRESAKVPLHYVPGQSIGPVVSSLPQVVEAAA